MQRQRSAGDRQEAMGSYERMGLAGAGAALILAGLYRRGWTGAGLALTGGALAGCALGRHSLMGRGLDGAVRGWADKAAQFTARPVHVEEAITILKPRVEVYNFWRDLRNLPRFMTQIERIDVRDGRRSHWVVKAPAGTRVEWDAEITRDEAPESISWEAVGDPDIPNGGTVNFREAPGGRGTEVHVALHYRAPAGEAGRLFAMLFGREPSQQAHASLRRLKQLLETGEIATVEGQPSGRAAP